MHAWSAMYSVSNLTLILILTYEKEYMYANDETDVKIASKFVAVLESQCYTTWHPYV